MNSSETKIAPFFLLYILPNRSLYIMSNGTDESWATARYILNKIDRECTISRIRQHNNFRHGLQNMMEVCNGVIRANANVITDDVRQLLEQHCAYEGVPHMLIMSPEIQYSLTASEEERVYQQQLKQFSQLTELVSDDKQRKEQDPNIYIVLDLDHTLINTYEYNSQVRFL